MDIKAGSLCRLGFEYAYTSTKMKLAGGNQLKLFMTEGINQRFA